MEEGLGVLNFTVNDFNVSISEISISEVQSFSYQLLSL